jgi:hypothetical protein
MLSIIYTECRITLTFVMLPFVMLSFLKFQNKSTLGLQSDE